MKFKNILLVVLLSFGQFSFALTITNTFNGGDIPTNNGNYDPTCNGAASPLTVSLPAGGPWVVTSVDVEYDMTSAGGGWMSEQQSQLFCQNTGLDEGTDFSGAGNNGGTQSYNRTALNIANGQFVGGTNLIFELQAFRTWAGTAGCNANVAKIDDGTWMVTVHYELAAPMTYMSSNTFQASTANVQNCSSSAQILKIEVETSGTIAPLHLTQLNLTTIGSTNGGEISNLNVYYTGAVNSFSNANLFGTVALTGNVTINGNQTLGAGINYFWIEYELITPTTVANVLDGTCTDITLGGNVQIPTTISPIGNRLIGICNPSPGGIDNNLTLWLDAKNGAESGGNPAVDLDLVDKWVNKVTNLGLTDLDQTNNAQKPVFNDINLNYNPVLTFDGNNDKLNKSVLGSDIFDTDNNTIVMVHRYNNGVVYFKWEQGSNGNRVGYENTGNSVRFDFPTDAPGDQNISTFNYDPNGQIVTATTIPGSTTLRNMGIAETANNTTGALNTNFTSELSIGDNVSFPLGSDMDYAEIIVYNRTLNAIELNKVESYLALKYGMTLGINGVSLNYNSAAGVTVWDIALNTGFNFDIGGVSRDDNAGQDQRKSKSINLNGVTNRDILTVSNGLGFNVPSQFTADASCIVWGHNDGTLTNTGVAVNYTTDNGQTMSTIFDRVWKSQETGTVTDVTMEFDMSNSSISLAGGVTDYNNVRLLVDEDGNFSTGATAYTPTSFDATTNLVYFQHDFTPTNGNDLTQNNGFFFTLASTESIVANFAMNDTTICAGETIIFSDSSFISPTGWDWTFNGGDVTSANTQGPHSITFNTPGTYDILLTASDANGSDDSTLQIIVNAYPTLDAGLNDTICEGENYTLTAVINGANTTLPIWDNGVLDGVQFTPTDSIMYHVTTTIEGCESIDSVSIDLTEVPDIIVPLDFSICAGEDTLLNAISTTANAITTWDNGIINNQLFTPLVTTTYIATSTLTEGTVSCTTTDQTEIIVNIIPSINAGTDGVICEGENYTLTGVNPDGAGLVWNNGINDNVVFSPIDSLEYIVIATLNGCENSDTVSVDVNPNPQLIMPLSVSICDGEDVVLNATSINSDTLIWDNGITNNQIFTPANTATYTATATITEGTNICTTTESVTVTVDVNPVVNADVSGSTLITLCAGENHTLTANNPSGGMLTWTNGITDNVSFTPTDSLMYYVTTTLNGCIGIDSIIVDVVDSPIVQTGLDQRICEGDSVLLIATTNQPLATITWDLGITNNTYVYPTSTQNYTVTASLGNCSITDDITITIVNSPDAGFSYNPNPVTVEDTEISFTQFTSYDGETYHWSFGDNMSSTLDSPIHIYPEVAGSTYEVQLIVTDSIGCMDSSSTQVTIYDVLVYYIPNAFTPDGDQYNQTFQPVFTSGFDPQEYHFIIFNRWGETMFESYNHQMGWDGTYNGSAVPDGVYVWTVLFGELLSDKKIIDRGTVTVLR